MYKILKKEKVATDTFLLQIQAPRVAKAARPGQFIILQIDEHGERIPLTISDYTKTTVTVIFLAIGYTTKKLSKLRKGMFIKDFMGPLGNPTDIQELGTVLLIGGGLGIAACYPIAKAMKKEGNEVISILGAKTKKHLFLLDEFEKVSDELIVCTDDGSYGKKGYVTESLRLELRKHYFNKVITIGPEIMMMNAAEITKNRAKTICSLNPIIVDGIGMCGSCRVTVDGKTKFACVDGPEFDSHEVDWEEFMMRNKRFSKQEKHICRIRKK